ncbi:MAG: phosphotransferase, partial [Acidimicrobiales bacterium]
AYRWLELHRPAPGVAGVVHGDFRLGNLLVDVSGLRAILDWELAHLGDPYEDLAWPTIRAWRFDRYRPLGSFPETEPWLAAYEAEAGVDVDRDAVRWWQVAGTWTWAVISAMQARRHLLGPTPSLEHAAIGRRVCESEYDLLELLP